jgi:hypothetical protein
MVRRADPPRAARSRDTAPRRFEVERAWLWRAFLVALAIGLLLLIAKVSMMAFDGVGKRLGRHDPGAPAPPAKAREVP